MRTLADKLTRQVRATGVRFVGDVLYVSLSDSREVALNMNRVLWLRWLLNAKPAQRAKWSIEPGGFAIYWTELDDGIEVRHLLGMEPIDQAISRIRVELDERKVGKS